MLLEKMGILGPLRPRWNKDGSLNIKPGTSSLTLNETPKQMLKNAYALTEACAVLQICLQSPAYKAPIKQESVRVARFAHNSWRPDPSDWEALWRW
jgi:hypothetical protein